MPDQTITTPRRALPSVLGAPDAPPAPVTVVAPHATGERPRHALAVLLVLAVAKLGVHLAANAISPYGIHRDELLYMAMGRHLHMWRMDFPPFVALVSELSRGTFGNSLVAIRLAPALAGAATVVLAVLIARVLGGNRTAQGLAGLAVLTSPLFLRSANLFQPVVFDQLWWTLGLYALARIGRDAMPTPRGVRHRAWADGRPHQTPTPSAGGQRVEYRLHGHAPLAALLDRPSARWWLLVGAAAGLGLLTKFSIAFFGVGALVGLLASPLRRALLGPWPWVALVVALAIGAPSLSGQLALDWPVLGQMRELRAAQLDRVGPLDFLAGQLAVGPALLLALLGLRRLLTDPELRAFRAVAWTCVAAFVLLLVAGGKAYYAAPIYPALFAAGGVALERLTHAMARRQRRVARAAAALALVAFGLVTLPLGVPVLWAPQMARYTAIIGAQGAANTTNTGVRLAIPQDYADMIGWPQQVVAVARAYDSLPPEKREAAVVIAGNYGQAGAIDFYGPRLGLPPVVSAAGSYWFFGPGRNPGTVAVTIGVPPEELRRYYRRVTPVGRVAHDQLVWVVPEERGLVVAIGEEPYRTLQEVWPSLRPD